MSDMVRLSRGCWLPSAQAGSLGARCAAILDTAPPDTVVVGMTAARLHGLWLPERPAGLEFATRTVGRSPNRMTRPRRPELTTHRWVISDDEIMVFRGVRVTTAARTWRDLASTLELADLVAAGDSVLRSATAMDELHAAVDRGHRRRGAQRAAQALAMVDARSRSRPESHLRVALMVAQLPRFEVNVAIFNGDGEWLAEPDLSLAPARIALEYQGEFHAEANRMRRDITRSGDLRRAGWLELSYGPAEVFSRPWQIAPEIRALVRARAPQLLRPRRRRPPASSRVGSSASSGQL